VKSGIAICGVIVYVVSCAVGKFSTSILLKSPRSVCGVDDIAHAVAMRKEKSIKRYSSVHRSYGHIPSCCEGPSLLFRVRGEVQIMTESGAGVFGEGQPASI